jgi:hypothetical protein
VEICFGRRDVLKRIKILSMASSDRHLPKTTTRITRIFKFKR